MDEFSDARAIGQGRDNFSQQIREKQRLAQAQDRQAFVTGLIAGDAPRNGTPAEAAADEAREAADQLRKVVEQLRTRLGPVLAPEPSTGEQEAKRATPMHGGSPIVTEFGHLARMSESTAAVLSDLLRRLEV
ncbi:hypothetical protein [Variovorax sp. JS1663]|uniref:hypothetical protein n=1 Tax=Variovorax sp. JS1663 TaxID=1851577 RepID=UPI000B346662|nr:hypothetical protein [Variovorax sp. JS1663]OUM01655.1 hypothetical protein A8M77_15390 [Variovorax sp. JS1663]